MIEMMTDMTATTVQNMSNALPAPQVSDGLLHVSVIGVGKIAEEHLRFLAAAPGVDLAAICDLSPALGNHIARRVGAGHAYTDYERMLHEVRPDVVHVLTPPHTHGKLVRDCLCADAHVIVEKPIAPSNSEFQELWALARQRSRWLVEDHNYRFNRPILEIERAVGQGRLGDVREVEVRMALSIRGSGGRYADANLPHPSHRLPAGVLHEFITHLCYLLLRFAPDVEQVTAAWRNCGGGDLFKYDDLDALITAGPVRGRLRFTCQSSPDCFTVYVRGTRGWAETDLFQPYLRMVTPRPGGAKLSPLVNHFANGWNLMGSSIVGFANKVLQHTPYEGLHTFLNRCYQALQDGVEPPVGYQDMDRASRLIDALLDPANRV